MDRLRHEKGVSPIAVLTLLALVGWLIRAWSARQGFFGYDLQGFSEWMLALSDHPWSQFYSLPLQVPPDHLPGTLWVLAGAGEIQRTLGSPDTFSLLKAIGITADVAAGLMVYLVARCVTGVLPSLGASAAYLLNPAPIFVAGYWGQWDAISIGLMLAALAFTLRNRPVIGLTLVTASMLFKPQFALIGLLMAAYIVVSRYRQHGADTTTTTSVGTRIVHALSPIVVGAAGSLALVTGAGYPFGVGLVPGLREWTYLERMRFAIERYDSTSSGALGVWLLSLGTSPPPSDQIHLTGVLTYSVVATGLTAMGGVLAYLLLARYRFSPTGLLVSSCAILWAFCIFGTRLHERYFLPVLALLIVVSATMPMLRPLAALISLTCFVNLYLAFSYHDWSIPLASWRTGPVLSTLSLVAVLGWVVFMIVTFAETRDRSKVSAPRALVPRAAEGVRTWETSSVSRSAN